MSKRRNWERNRKMRSDKNKVTGQKVSVVAKKATLCCCWCWSWDSVVGFARFSLRGYHHWPYLVKVHWIHNRFHILYIFHAHSLRPPESVNTCNLCGLWLVFCSSLLSLISDVKYVLFCVCVCVQWQMAWIALALHCIYMYNGEQHDQPTCEWTSRQTHQL